jgi:hypothetical protein
MKHDGVLEPAWWPDKQEPVLTRDAMVPMMWHGKLVPEMVMEMCIYKSWKEHSVACFRAAHEIGQAGVVLVAQATFRWVKNKVQSCS